MRRRTVLCNGFAILAAGFLPRGAHAGIRSDTRGAAAILGRVSAARRDAQVPGLIPQHTLMDMAYRQVLRMHGLGATTHTGTDGSDPIARAWQAEYEGHPLGETLAETYDGALETVDLWLAHAPTQAVLLDPAARDIGVFGIREETGLAWWDLVVGAPNTKG